MSEPTHLASIGGSSILFHRNPPPCFICGAMSYSVKRRGDGWSLDCRSLWRIVPTPTDGQPMRLMLQILLAAPLVGVQAMDGQVRVDQPDAWWEPSASHHGKHFEGGAVLGVIAYEVTGLATPSPAARYAVAIGTGVVVGIGFEVVRGWDGSSYIDPVDSIWCVAGSVVGAGLSQLTGEVVTLITKPGQVAVAVAFRF